MPSQAGLQDPPTHGPLFPPPQTGLLEVWMGVEGVWMGVGGAG